MQSYDEARPPPVSCATPEGRGTQARAEPRPCLRSPDPTLCCAPPWRYDPPTADPGGTAQGRERAMELGFEILIVLLLILLNGLFSMSELALVSARRTRLAVLERKGVIGAATARVLAEDPQRFLPTVQVGITLVSVLTGVFGGARIASHIEAWLLTIPVLGASRRPPGAGAGRGGDHLPDPGAGRAGAQAARAAPAGAGGGPGRPPDRLDHADDRPRGLAAGDRPPAWCCALFGLHRAPPQAVTEEELKALLAEGAQTGVLETEERDMIERVLRLADKPVRAIMTPRTELAWIDRTDPRRDIVATLKSAPHSRFVVCDGAVDNVVGVVQAKDILDRHPRRRGSVDQRGAAPADRGARHRHARWTRWSG